MQNSNTATAAASAAPSLASGAGLTSSSNGQGGQSSPSASSRPSYSPNTATSPGQWSNLQDYLNVNNGGQFGNQFSQNIGNDLTSAQTALGNASTNFANEVNSGTVQNNQDIIGDINNDFSSPAPIPSGTTPAKINTGTPVTGLGSLGSGSPLNFSADQISAFQNQLNGSYTGPQSAAADSGLSQAGQQAQNAYQEVQAAQTPGGQQALLQKYYSAPNYSEGAQGLDSAILSADPNAQSSIQALAPQGSNLLVANQNAQSQANNLAATGAGNSSAAQQAALQALYGTGTAAAPVGGAFGGVESAIQGQLANATTAQTADWNQLNTDLGSGNVTQADLAMLNGAPAFGSNSYGITPSQLLSFASQQSTPTQDSVTTAQQEAQLNALYGLAGTQNTFTSDPTQVGTYNSATPINFNATGPNGFNQTLQTDQTNYQNALAAQQAIINQHSQFQIGNQMYTFDPSNPNSVPNYAQFMSSSLGQANAQQITAAREQIAKLNEQYNTKFGGAPISAIQRR